MNSAGSKLTDHRLAICFSFLTIFALLCLAASSQEIQFGAPSTPHKNHVELLSDALDLKAGELQVVQLRFKVDDGFHINSHSPKDELLIPTALQLNSANGIKVAAEDYPRGSTFRLPLAPDETLDVYQGEFRVTVRLVVPKGATTLTGGLRYQACDNASCFPPRTLPVNISVTGR